MNILPKKSWHVRNKQNIERVRRDEAKAAEEQKEIERRIALAESEARTELLRAKARKRGREDDDVQELQQPTGHINFFREEEEGLKKSGTNAEYEAEKKMEKEKQEKAIGLLTYLGQSAIESQNEKPWYFKPPEKKQKLEGSQESVNLTKKKEEFDLKHKWSADPMKMMVQYIDTKEKVLQRDKGDKSNGSDVRVHLSAEPQLKQSSASHVTTETSNLYLTKHKRQKKRDKHGKKRKKEHKKKRKHKHKRNKKSSMDTESAVSVTTAVTSRGKSIQELRAERIRRENEEKKKRELLLAKLRGEVPKEEEVPTEREQRYNSQFNPELVRRKKKKQAVVTC